MTEQGESAEPTHRRRRWPFVLAGAAVVVLAAGSWIGYQALNRKPAACATVAGASDILGDASDLMNAQIKAGGATKSDAETYTAALRVAAASMAQETLASPAGDPLGPGLASFTNYLTKSADSVEGKGTYSDTESQADFTTAYLVFKRECGIELR